MLYDSQTKWKIIDEELTAHSLRKPNPEVPVEFIDFSLKDYAKLMDNIHYVSRPSNSKIQLAHNITYTISENLIFDANASLKEDNFYSTFSFGALTGLQDLFCRLACNKDFFSFDPQKNGERQFDGADCCWLDLGGSLQPNVRYYDYHLKKKNDSYGTFLSAYYTALPLDAERRKLASLMFEIAVSWVMMHEEGHYCEGHLLYLNNCDSSSMSAINEISEHNDSKNKITLRKVFEWQADRAATRAVIDMYFKKEFLEILPSYTNENKTGWLIRLILTSIGSTILLFKKAQNIGQEKQFNCEGLNLYPSERSRLIACVINAFMQLQANNSNQISNIEFNIKTLNDITDIFEAPILGTLDELSTVSNLINQEGIIISHEPGMPPEIKSTRKLNLLDTTEEAQLLSELILRKILTQNTIKDYFGEKTNNITDKLDDEWFGELLQIIQQHDNCVYPLLQPYRVAAGMS